MAWQKGKDEEKKEVAPKKQEAPKGAEKSVEKSVSKAVEAPAPVVIEKKSKVSKKDYEQHPKFQKFNKGVK
jgi:hypothetical protein